MNNFLNARARHISTTGLAMFSMFFGAGNIAFPLKVGQLAGTQSIPAILGLLLTAVGVPFLGLLAIILYEGDYRAFFARIGRIPGFLVTFFLLIILGPIGAIPRCIALSYGTIKIYDPALSVVIFSSICCLFMYLAAYKKSRIVGLLGTVLSPVLVASLAIIIVKGMLIHPTASASMLDAISMFKFGLYEGYNTMDLLAAFFFSSVVIAGLRQSSEFRGSGTWSVARDALWASVIGAVLLGLVYAGFVLVASYYGSALTMVPAEVLLGTIAQTILGPIGGLLVGLTVVLTCFTTALALASVFAEFLHADVSARLISYHTSLLITLVITFVFANFTFSEIVAMLDPILIVLYPTLLVLTIMNILHKLYGISMVKIPVMIATIASIIWYYAPQVLTHIGVAV